MSLEESSRMSRKTPSQDSNFEAIWWEMEAIEPLTPLDTKSNIYKTELKKLCGREPGV